MNKTIKLDGNSCGRVDICAFCQNYHQGICIHYKRTSFVAIAAGMCEFRRPTCDDETLKGIFEMFELWDTFYDMNVDSVVVSGNTVELLPRRKRDPAKNIS
ncbi:MAG: hypothetical protein LBU34_13520 [Planctomycetaceae bacterium]|jgi:hypothetical protein|nr:hypothetical protein [Planctomycetaceae bacterium]